MNEPALEDRVAALERLVVGQQNGLILLTDTVFDIMAKVGMPMDESDEGYQNTRQMAAKLRQERGKG